MSDLERVAGERVAGVVERQRDLLGLPEPAASKAREVERRRAGRPVGSRNRRLEDAARFVVEHFGDPLLHQVAIATMDVDELAAALGCKPLEAVIEKRLAAATVLPYLHRRQPVQVDLTNTRVVHLTIVDPAAPPTTAGEDAVAEVVEIMEYQRLEDEANGGV